MEKLGLARIIVRLRKHPDRQECLSCYVTSELMSRPVLIIEDDPDISESLKYNFEREGLPAITALTGEAGLTAALNDRNPPLLIILDLMLPGMSGTELCRRLRREPTTRRTPIIMLTAKASESDRVAGLDLGADDYITKPFSVRELLARV